MVSQAHTIGISLRSGKLLVNLLIYSRRLANCCSLLPPNRNNGFLKSWSIYNLQNIIITLPLLVITASALLEYIYADIYKVIGLWSFEKYVRMIVTALRRTVHPPDPTETKRIPRKLSSSAKPRRTLSVTPTNYPFMFHWAAVAFLVAFYMQIQTGIRALMAVPMLHIYVASLHDQKSLSRRKYRAFHLILMYYVIYSSAAAALLGYGYPPI